MQHTKQGFTLKERFMVVAILLVLAIVAMQNLVQSVTESEERTVDAAAFDYAGVKNMYAERPGSAPAAIIQASAIETEAYPSAPIK